MTKEQSNYIKLIAIITMFVDHMGLILFPHQLWFRIIGRIALPLFAYQLGVGYKHTKNFKKYIFRLLAFGVGLQLIYIISTSFFGVNEDPFYLNIFFTLILGLLAIFLFDTGKRILLIPLFLIPLLLKHFGITIDYGTYGIALILLLFIFKNNPKRLVIIIAIISFYYGYITNSMQVYCLLSMIFILKPINLKIRIPNYVFYLFYPLHLAFLYMLNMLLP